jgi:hypothetical protein
MNSKLVEIREGKDIKRFLNKENRNKEKAKMGIISPINLLNIVIPLAVQISLLIFELPSLSFL